jgi:hypothetical protein
MDGAHGGSSGESGSSSVAALFPSSGASASVQVLPCAPVPMTGPLLAPRIARLTEALSGLGPSQLGWIEAVVSQFGRPASYWRDPASDLITHGMRRGGSSAPH